MKRFTQSTVLSALALALICLGAGCSQKARKAQALARANRFFDAGRYDKAEDEYISVLRLEQTNVPALSRLGRIYLEEGRVSRAAYCFRMAGELAPGDLEVREKLALIYSIAGKPQEAYAHALYVLDRKPADEEAPLLAAQTVTTTNQYFDLLKRLRNLPVLPSQTAPREVALGALALRERPPNYKDAEAAFRRAQAVNPKFSPLYSALGMMYVALTNREEAETAFRLAAELSPDRSPRKIKYAQFKAQNNDLAGARTILEEVLKKTPDFVTASLELAKVAAAQTNYDEALALLSKVLARDADNFEAQFMDANVKIAKRDLPAATLELEAMMRTGSTPTNYFPRIQYELAQLHRAQGAPQKAMDALRLAVRLDPDYAQAVLALADYQIDRGDTGPAIEALKRVVAKQPRIIAGHLKLARAYERQNSFQEALDAYSKWSGYYPNDPQPVAMAGNVYLQLNRKEEARKLFTRALQMYPDYLPALERLVDLDAGENQFATALKRVQDEIQRTPTNAALHLIEARVLLSQHTAAGTNQAEVSLGKAVELQPDFSGAYMMLAGLYHDSQRQEKALEDLRRIPARDPRHVGALMLIGTIQTEQQDYKAARATYEKLLAINPEFPPALNNLAYLYSEQFGEVEEAYQKARKARDLLPAEPFTADTLGWVVYKRGDNYPWSVSLLSESVGALPNEVEVHYHLGMALYMLGDEARARIELQKATEPGKAFRGREEAQRRLAILNLDPATPAAELQPRLEKRLSEQADDPVVLVRLAALFAGQGNAEKAKAAYERALKASPDDLAALVGLAGLCSEKPEDRARGYELAKSAYKLAQDDPAVLQVLGRLAHLTGDHAWGLALLEEASAKRPDDLDLLFDRAGAAYSVGRVAEAQTMLRKVAEAGPRARRSAEAKNFLDLIALSLDPARALAASSQVDKALLADSNNVPALMARALIESGKTNLAGARQDYARVLGLYRDFTPAKRGFAILAAEDSGGDRKTYELALAAREAFPGDRDLSRAFGIILYQQKNYDEAARILADIAKGTNADARLMYYLGMAQVRSNQKAEAKKSLQKALDLGLTGDAAKLSSDALKNLSK